MFDCFVDSKFPKGGVQQSDKPSRATLISHIIHVSYAPPDEARNPSWNMNYLLDDVTLESLPDEFRKVCI